MNHTTHHWISNDLESEITRLNQSLETLGKEKDDFLGDLLAYVLINSGKRIRPMLVVLSSGFGDADPEQVHRIEMAVELIHIATLVHDDILDHADLRRGQKTVASQHGVDTAILLGDFLYTLAFEKIMEVDNNAIFKTLVNAASIMCSGEIDQLNNKYQYNLSKEKYYSFIEKKTACFFGAAATVGAILADQNPTIQAALESFGINLGIGFQIKDDLLDLTGDEDIVGKTLHTDLLNGKMTLPVIHFKNNTSPDNFDKMMQRIKNSEDQIDTLLDRLEKTGSIKYSENAAKIYIQKALTCLHELPDGPSKDQLYSLAERSLKRKA